MEIVMEKTKLTRISRKNLQYRIWKKRKKLENLEYFNYLSSLITKDAR
jgi:hypothetical protein